MESGLSEKSLLASLPRTSALNKRPSLEARVYGEKQTSTEWPSIVHSEAEILYDLLDANDSRFWLRESLFAQPRAKPVNHQIDPNLAGARSGLSMLRPAAWTK